MSRYNSAAELASELTTSQQEVADLRDALEAAAAVHLRDVALLHDLQPKPRAGEPAAGMQRPGYASSLPAADKLDFMAAAPAYSGLAAAQPCGALPFPSDDAMCCSSTVDGHEVAVAGSKRWLFHPEAHCVLVQGNGSPASEPGTNAGGAASITAARPAADVEGGQARLAWSSRPPAGGRGGRAAGGGGGPPADSNCSGGTAEDLDWKEKYLALFTRTLQLEFKATAWRNEHGRMLRALRSEVGEHADLEAVLSASGGDVNAAAAPWRGRAATIGLLQERLRAAQAAAGQAPASPPSSPSSTTQRLSRRTPATPSAAAARRAEAESLRAELAAAQHAAAQAQAAAQKAATRRTILEAEVKGLRGHLAVLLRKAGNDDRLIAALQGALRQRPGGSGNSLHHAAGSAAASDVVPDGFAQGADTNAAAGSGPGSSAGRLHSANVLRVSSISSASGISRKETYASRAATTDEAAVDSEPAAQPVVAADSLAQLAQEAVPPAGVCPPACDPDEAVNGVMPPDAAVSSDAEAMATHSALQPLSSDELPEPDSPAAENASTAGAASVAAPQASIDSAAADAPDAAANLSGNAKQDAAGAKQTLQDVQQPAAELPDAPQQPADVHVSVELAGILQTPSGDAVSEPESGPATADSSCSTVAAAEQTAATVTPDASGGMLADAEALQEAQAAVASSIDDTQEVEDAELTADSSVWELGGAAASSGAFELHADSAGDSNGDSLRPAFGSLQQSFGQDIEGGAAEADTRLVTIQSAADLQTEDGAATGDEAATTPEDTAAEQQLNSSGSQGTFVAAMAAAFGQPDDVMNAYVQATAAVQPNSSEDVVDADDVATSVAESDMANDINASLQLGDDGSPAEAAMDAAAAASAAFAAAAEAAAAATATAAQAAAAEVLLAAPRTEDAQTPAAPADAGSEVAALPPERETGATTSAPLEPVAQVDEWQATLPADGTVMPPDAQQLSAADILRRDVDAALGSGDIADVAEQLETAVSHVEAATGGESQPDALADTASEGSAAGSAAVAAAAAEQLQAPADATSDEVYGIDTRPSQTNDDSAADAE